MSKITVKSLLFICLAIIPFTFFGQNNNGNEQKANNDHYWSIGFDEGATLLFGDNKSWDFKNVRPELGVFAGYTFAKHYTAYARFSAGTLRGELNKTLKIENSSYLEFDINLAADVVSLIKGYDPDRKFGLLPHVGFGQMQYQTRAIVNGKQVKIGYDEAGAVKGNGIAGRKVVWDIPMGIQFEYNINRNCALTFDVTTVKMDTDNIDALPQGKHYDWYSEATVGFKYKFRKADPVPEPEPCPEYAPMAAAPTTLDCESCADAIKQAVKEAVDDAMKNYQPAPAPAPQAMEAEEEDAETTETLVELQKNFEEKDIHLTFKVGKAEVKDNAENQNEVKKISDDIAEGREIHTIKTLGYASPEGNDKQNKQLSEDRAKATNEYLKEKLGKDANGINFDAEGMGADWKGFYKALENSNIANKAEIASKIRNAQDKTAKLNEMKAKYPELGELLNGLRVTRVYINK